MTFIGFTDRVATLTEKWLPAPRAGRHAGRAAPPRPGRARHARRWRSATRRARPSGSPTPSRRCSPACSRSCGATTRSWPSRCGARTTRSTGCTPRSSATWRRSAARRWRRASPGAGPRSSSSRSTWSTSATSSSACCSTSPSARSSTACPSRRPGLQEISDLHARLIGNLQLSVAVFLNGDLKSAQRLIAREGHVPRTRDALRREPSPPAVGEHAAVGRDQLAAPGPAVRLQAHQFAVLLGVLSDPRIRRRAVEDACAGRAAAALFNTNQSSAAS